MYNPNYAYWLIVTLLICGVWFAVQSVRCKGKPGKKMIVGWFAAVGGLLLINVIAHYNDHKLLEEFRGIHADGIAKLSLSQGDQQREVTARSEITNLMSAMQSIQNVASHRSHPVNKVDIRFSYEGQTFHYRLGRDSERPDEYWIERITNEDEGPGPTIVQGNSLELSRLLEGMLNKNPEQAER